MLVPALWCAASLASLDTPALAQPRDVIRVGGPSAPRDAKVAFVGSSRDLAGASFTVVDRRGGLVLRGRLRERSGAPAPWLHGYAADLTAIGTPGRYRLRVGRLVSRPWVVRPHGSRTAIPVLLRFFA